MISLEPEGPWVPVPNTLIQVVSCRCDHHKSGACGGWLVGCLRVALNCFSALVSLPRHTEGKESVSDTEQGVAARLVTRPLLTPSLCWLQALSWFNN